MRRLPSVPIALLALAAGCSAPPPVVLLKIGSACAENAECGSNLCRDGVCTKVCVRQVDCPRGFDCGPATPEAAEATCYAALWTEGEGTVGTNCAAVAGGCTTAASPCAPGYECLATIKCDPEAYCSAACTSDAQCPPRYYCGWTGPANDPNARRMCLARGSCSTCLVDDQCPEGFLCNQDPEGKSYCAKACNVQADCRRPFKISPSQEMPNPPVYPPFEVCGPDAWEREQQVCQPAGHYCSGPSVITSITGDGQVCSPCRPGIREDCAAGHTCIEVNTGEAFCTKPCSVRLTQGGNGGYSVGQDTCPAGAHCYFYGQVPSGCGSACNVNGFCAGDPRFLAPTCYPVTR